MIAGIEIDMYKEITVSDMATVSIIPGRWLKRGLRKNTEILRGKTKKTIIQFVLLMCVLGRLRLESVIKIRNHGSTLDTYEK